MDNKLKLTRIELQTKNSKKIMLTIDEAKELYQQLDELFGDKDTSSQIPIIFHDYPWPWTYPYRQVTYDSTSAKVESASGMTLIYNADETGA